MAFEKDNLPSEWRWESLEKIAADGAPILYGILQPGPDTAGGIPYVRPTEIVEDVIDLSSIRRTTPAIAAKYKRSVLKPDDVILSIVGTIGKVAVVPPALDGGNITQSSVRVRPRAEVVSPRYVAWVLRSPVLRRQFDKHRLGTAVPRLNVAHVRALRVPVPPLPEQRRIVAEIEKQFTRLDAGVAALRRVQANLKRYRATVLKAACEGRLVPNEAELVKTGNRKSKFETGEQLLQRILAERRKCWAGRGQYKEPVAPEPLDDIELPEGWVWTGFEQLADGTKNAIKAGPFGSSLKKSFYTPRGFKIYGQEQVIKGDAYFGDYFISRDLFEQLQSCEVKPGDILISLVGTTGKVLILPDDCAPGIINPRLLKLSLNHSGVNAKFIKILLESATTRAFFKLAAHGGTMEILNLGILKTLPIALPPLAEQTRIVTEVERRLSVVEEMEAVVSANLQRATRLRQSILQKAFTGELIC